MAFRTHQGNDSRPRSSDMHHRGDDSPSDGRKQSRQSTRASSNSAAENAARGPRCSVFFPGWRKTRLWGLSKHLEVAEKARKGAAKRQKRQKSRQWGPERHAEAMQRGPLAAFPAIPRAKPCNYRFPAKKKPAKRYEHLAGFDPNRPRTASSLPAAALRRE